MGDRVDSWLKDFAFGVRTLRKSPAFAITALVTLALGIGATTAIFSVVNAVLLRPLPYRDPDQLVLITADLTKRHVLDFPLAPGDLKDIRDQVKALDGVAGVFTFATPMTGDESDPVQIHAPGSQRRISSRCSASKWRRAATSPTTTRPHRRPLPCVHRAIPPPRRHRRPMSRSWATSSGSAVTAATGTSSAHSSPSAVARRSDRRHRAATSSSCSSPRAIQHRADAGHLRRGARRTQFGAAQRRPLPRDRAHEARRDDSVGAWRAAADEQRLRRAILRQRFTIRQEDRRMEPLHAELVGDVKSAVLALMGGVMFVLLIACANVANLILVRTSRRERELAVRAALGGSRARLVRQMLAEAFVLGVSGAALGLVLAEGGISLLMAMGPAHLPRVQDVTLDPTVLVFTIVAGLVSMVAVVLFGVVPAIRASRPDLMFVLRASGRSAGLGGGGALRSGVAIAEVTLAFVLLIGSGLMLRSFVTLVNTKPGYDASGLETLFAVQANKALPADRNARNGWIRGAPAARGDSRRHRCQLRRPLPFDGDVDQRPVGHRGVRSRIHRQVPAGRRVHRHSGLFLRDAHPPDRRTRVHRRRQRPDGGVDHHRPHARAEGIPGTVRGRQAALHAVARQ